MEIVKLSPMLASSFGFDTKLDYGTEVSFMGNNPRGGTWRVGMTTMNIVLSVSDLSGNTVYAIYDNDDANISGFEASIMIKAFYRHIDNAVNTGTRLNKAYISEINGRNMNMCWIDKKGSK